jgi:hypothetical protein
MFCLLLLFAAEKALRYRGPCEAENRDSRLQEKEVYNPWRIHESADIE